MNRAFVGVVAFSTAVLLGVAVPACGGDSKTPPKLPTIAADAAPGETVKNDKGETVGTTSTPDERAGLTGDAKVAYDRGFQAWMVGDLQAAKAGFLDAIGKAPSSPAPHYSLGTVLERLGDTQAAQGEYEKAYTADPLSEQAMGSYALSLARTGKGGQAESFLNFQHQKNPDMVRLTIFLAEVKSLNGDSTSCQQLAQEALKKQPDNTEAMLVIARDYFRTRRYDVALYACGAVLEGSENVPAREKENAEAKFLRGLIKREIGDRRGALADLEDALKKRPDLFEAYVGLGELRLEAGNAQEALDPLEKAVKYSPKSALAHLDLGDCYRLLNRAGDAKAQFDTALQLDSTLAGVHYNLGLLYLYAPTVPGVGSQEAQVEQAIKELDLFKTMRGARPARGQGGDDVDELLSTAKRKQGELRVKNTPVPAEPPPPPAAGDAGAPAPAAPRDGGTR